MAWGKKSHGVDDLVMQLRRNCTAETMCVMRSRKFDAEEVTMFSNALGPNTSLKALLLAGHPLSPEAAAVISESLGRNRALERLTLGDPKFGDEGLKSFITGGLQRNGSLTSLDLEFRGLSPASALLLGAFLGGPPHESAVTSDGSSSSSSAREDGEDLGPPALKELLLGRNTLAASPPAFAALLRGVRSHAHLTSLDVSGNGVLEAGADAASTHLALLAGQPTLEKLLLSDNAFGPFAAPHLSTLLRTLPRLAVLDVDGTGLGDAGLVELAQALEACTRCPLEELCAARNAAGPLAAAALASALPRCPRLRVLRLGSNALGDAGASALASTAVVATGGGRDGGGRALDLLDVARNGIGGEGAAALVGAASRGLTSDLVLLGNPLGDEGVSTLAAAFKPKNTGGTGSAAAAGGGGGGGGGGGAAGQQQTVQLLRVLDLTGSGLTFVALPALLDAVAAWPPQKRLTVLVLGGNKCVGGSEGRAVLDNFKVDQGVDVQYDTEAEDEKEGEKEKNEEEAKQSDGGGGGSSLAAQKTAMPPPAPDAPPAKWIGQGPPTPAEAAAAALAPPASLAFKLGDSVTVQGLTTAARYNGKSGIVSSGLLNGRVAVWVEAEKKSISVKPENIEAASTPKA